MVRRWHREGNTWRSPGLRGHIARGSQGANPWLGGDMWQESLPRALKLPLSVLLPKRQPLPARPPAPSAQSSSGALPQRFPTNHSDCSDFISLLPGEEHVFLATGEPAAVRSSNFGRMVPQDGMLPRDGWPSGLTDGPQCPAGLRHRVSFPSWKELWDRGCPGDAAQGGQPQSKAKLASPIPPPAFWVLLGHVLLCRSSATTASPGPTVSPGRTSSVS